jgi:hypothetical protein
VLLHFKLVGYFPVTFLLLISSLIAYCQKQILYDFDSFKYVEVYFRVHNIIYLAKFVLDAKKNGSLILLVRMFYDISEIQLLEDLEFFFTLAKFLSGC